MVCDIWEFDDFSGTIEVREGISSEGDVLLSKHKHNTAVLKKVYSSHDGLYIRLHSMPFDWENYNFSFIYGLYKQVHDKSKYVIYFNLFLCKRSQELLELPLVLIWKKKMEYVSE